MILDGRGDLNEESADANWYEPHRKLASDEGIRAALRPLRPVRIWMKVAAETHAAGLV